MLWSRFRPVPDFISDLIVVKELTILGAFGVARRSYQAAIELIESEAIDLNPLHTHDFGLEDAETAIQTLAGEIPGENCIHACMRPSLG